MLSHLDMETVVRECRTLHYVKSLPYPKIKLLIPVTILYIVSYFTYELLKHKLYCSGTIRFMPSHCTYQDDLSCDVLSILLY